jgi:acyl-CoA synthetase (AMP-forming)/AMP-acid ligase II
MSTERRWYKVWPLWAPKKVEADRVLSEYIREWARITPGRSAVTFYGKDISYGELNEMIDRTAWGLVNLGVAKGDRVAVYMENCPQFVIAYFAAQRAGGVVVPINPMFKQAELEYEINDAGAETLIGLDSLYPEVEKARGRTTLKRVILSSMKDFMSAETDLPLPEEAKCEKQTFRDTVDLLDLIRNSKSDFICRVCDMAADLALLQYTGGTTGTPKGAMITHHALACAAMASVGWFRHRENDVILGVTPFFHVMGQVNLMCASMVCGCRLLILSRFAPEVVARVIARYRVTFWVAATPMIISLLNLPDIKEYDFSSFRCVVTGGAPVPGELQKRLAELAPNAAIAEGYGLSETASSGGATTPMFQYRPGFVGLPGINVDIRIMDRETESRELPPNQEGEIVIKGPSMMVGYWNKPEETKQMLRDGWLYTGDTGFMDEDGYIKFLGRTRELIKCSGFSVFPAEVEDLLYRHPAIKEAAIIGVEDPYRGESVKAFVVLKEEYAGKVTEQEIMEWCKDNMAAYKRPKFVEFRAELPKSAAGKVLRRVLVEEEQAGNADRQSATQPIS